MENLITSDQARIEYYRYIHRWKDGRREPRWRGTRVIKYPSDMIMYAQVLWKRKPDYIIETGTAYGGSALFFADILSLTGGKKVYTIDIRPRGTPEHPMIEYINCSSTEPKLIERFEQELNGNIMVVLDSLHTKNHVLDELNAYKNIVTKGQYIVVEDCYGNSKKVYGPFLAVKEFLKSNKNFKRYELEKQCIFAVTRGGWLRKI